MTKRIRKSSSSSGGWTNWKVNYRLYPKNVQMLPLLDTYWIERVAVGRIASPTKKAESQQKNRHFAPISPISNQTMGTWRENETSKRMICHRRMPQLMDVSLLWCAYVFLCPQNKFLHHNNFWFEQPHCLHSWCPACRSSFSFNQIKHDQEEKKATDFVLTYPIEIS